MAVRYGLRRAVVVEHRLRHLGDRVLRYAAQIDLQELGVKNLLAELVALYRRTLDILEDVVKDKPVVALKAIAEARQSLEVIAELTGGLRRSADVHVAVVELPPLDPPVGGRELSSGSEGTVASS